MRAWIPLICAATLSACVSEATREPCTADDRCLAGYECVSGACQPCALDLCPTSQITLLSTGGGMACDTEGTCVRFPPDALASVTEVEVQRTSNPNAAIGAPPLSRVYAIRPASLLPLRPVEVTFRVSRQVDVRTRVTIQRASDPRGPWESLDTTRDNTQASAYSNVLGFFALGRATDQPVEPRDGGTPITPGADAGPLAPTNPLPGISVPLALPGPLISIHGMAWDPQMQRMLFCDRTSGVILAFTHANQTAEDPTPFRNAVNNPYGVSADATGRILMMELGTRSITAGTSGPSTMMLADRFQGLRFNGPVDAAVRSDGTIYFTDPGTGLALTGQARELQFNGLFRREPAMGTITAEWQAPITAEPSGVELSPDGSTLYVADTAANAVLAWEVLADGSLNNRRNFVVTGAGPDGLAVDRDGNLYVGTMGGIEVFAPDGARWGIVSVPMRVGTLAFGGPNLAFLYATAASALYVMTVTVPGAR